MTPDQREKHLAEWPEEKRQILRAKLEVYDRLAPEERERRLDMLDLRYYMGPLLSIQPSPQRDARLAAIPAKYQETVRTRLAQWDRLSPELKERMIANEMALQYLTRLRRQSPPLPPGAGHSRNTTGNLRPDVQQRLQSWQKIPPEERRRLSRHLHRFFELPTAERRKTLETLSERERHEIQRSLDALNRMSPEQRQACIQSFNKLATMSPPEQILFLQNAARWQAMTKEERETWKKLVNNLPPLPPGEAFPPLPAADPPYPGAVELTNAQAGQ